MTLDEAIHQLQEFCNSYENEDIRSYVKQKYGDLGHTEKDYEATKLLLDEVERLKEFEYMYNGLNK